MDRVRKSCCFVLIAIFVPSYSAVASPAIGLQAASSVVTVTFEVRSCLGLSFDGEAVSTGDLVRSVDIENRTVSYTVIDD